MANKQNLLRYRFEAIESFLIWEGEITNSRLRQLFGLQSVQASRLIAEYRKTYPTALLEDSKRKGFLPEPGFKARVASGTVDEYAQWVATLEVSQARGIEEGRIDLTVVSPVIFSALRQACLQKAPIQIRYESMTRPEGSDRVIFPHTIVRVGRRWHARAWCCERKDYRDFALGRIRSASLLTPSNGDIARPTEIDENWERKASIRIAAHRSLDGNREKVIQNEYFGGAAARRITTRSCLAAYVIQDLRASINPDTQQPPDYQIEVTNVGELRRFLFPD